MPSRPNENGQAVPTGLTIKKAAQTDKSEITKQSQAGALRPLGLRRSLASLKESSCNASQRPSVPNSSAAESAMLTIEASDLFFNPFERRTSSALLVFNDIEIGRLGCGGISL